MYKNYFKIALRNLWKHKLFSMINILGLGCAMAFCFLQLMQIQTSFEKDTFHPYPDRTYRIVTDATGNDGASYSLASSPMPLGEELSNKQSIIEKSVRVIRSFGGTLNNGIKSLPVSGMYVDPAYFDIFGFKLEKGKPCVEPGTVVLSSETAERFFGEANPVGKLLTSKDLGTFTVTGVFADLKPYTTHLKSDMVVSMATFLQVNKHVEQRNWLDYNVYTFVLLTKGSKPETLTAALNQVSAENKKNVDFKEIKSHAFRAQPLGAISPDFENLVNNPYVEPVWKIGVSLLIPLVIILLAGFNYVNLTLTRSLSRGREVGVRKVAGASRWQLILQFLTETVIIAFLALGIGYLGLELIKSFVHVRWLNWEVQHTGILWIGFFIFTLFTGIVAGILPARILSSYEPVHIMKGDLGPAGFGKIGFRKSLIVIQFVVALVFMTFIGISNSQFEYMANDNENFNRKNILNISLSSDDYKLLSNEMARQTDVERVGVTSATLNESAGKIKISKDVHKKTNRENKDAYLYSVDANFIENMKLQFIAGSNLPAAATDTAVHFAVINERAVKVLGLGDAQEIIGKSILLNDATVQIVGVIRDFCFMRYELPVAPLVLAYDPQEIKVLSLMISQGASPEKVTESLTRIWKQYHPHESFVYSWYEKQLYEQYSDGGDQSFTRIIVFIVFVIAGMGLLGMVTYTTEKRTKEVGVRKVMGASVVQIMRLLSMGFVKLILLASVLALPLGYYLGSLFLNLFTYHTTLGPGIFLTCLASLLLIGLFTVGVQSYRTAVTNPAETLRSE